MVMKMINIQLEPVSPITIQGPLSYEGNLMRNRIWYRGEPSELDQFFKNTAIDLVSRSRFWANVPSKKLNIRKMHSGLPALMVETLAKIVVKDLNTIRFDKQEIEDLWEKISEDNKFNKLLKNSFVETLVVGDGAFKITIGTELNQYPIIEYFGGEKVDYTVLAIDNILQVFDNLMQMLTLDHLIELFVILMMLLLSWCQVIECKQFMISRLELLQEQVLNKLT